MSSPPEVLLTNDDGIDSPGIRAVYESLDPIANVTVVAPATDQSSVGRALSRTVNVNDHELGYAIEGTPADCVVAGLAALGPDPDIVISGCNEGANLGEYVLGRSGTISAAVEAAFFDVPAIALSLFVPPSERAFEDIDVPIDAYHEAKRVISFLLDYCAETALFNHVGYLNVNVPAPPKSTPRSIEITRPSTRYGMDAEMTQDGIVLKDRLWENLEPESIPDPDGTDRRAVVEGRVSVSPLVAPHVTNHHDSLDDLPTRYEQFVTDPDETPPHSGV